MTKIRVGLIGSGFVAELHMYAYKRVYGVDVEVAAVVSRGDHVEQFAKNMASPKPIAIREHSSPTRRSTSSIFARRRLCTPR